MARKARKHVPAVLLTAVSIVLVAILPEWKWQVGAVVALLAVYLLVAYGTTLLAKQVRLAWAVSGWTAVAMLGAVWLLGKPPEHSAVTVMLFRTDVGDLKDVTVSGEPSAIEGAAVMITGRVENSGPPTIVNFNQTLRVRLNTGELLTGTLEKPHNNLAIINRRTGQPTMYSPKDALVLKTSGQPVETGGQRDGVLIYTVQNVDADDLRVPGVVFTVLYRDAYGHNEEVSMPWRARQITPEEIDSRLPGMVPTPVN